MTITEPAEGRQSVRTASAVRPDHTARWVALFAAIISACAYAYYASRNMTLGYEDSVSHLQIAARTLNSPTAGFAQLGGVWLPLPHIMMLPLIWIEPFYYNGFAGSAVSMISYVVTCVYLFKAALDLTKSRTAALAGTLVFALNPNVLYMQSTPMTELLLFASMTAAVYYAQKWIQVEDHTKGYPYLFAAALAAFIGCLTRYEAWISTLVMAAVILLAAWRKLGRNAYEGVLFSYLFFAGAAIAMWLGWNALIFGNPLNFQNGEYAKPSLWVGADEKSVGDPILAAKTYWFAMVENLGVVLVLTMIVGAIVLVLTRRRLDTLPTLSLMAMAPFFIVALAVGQRPLHVEQITGDLYNVRFGLTMVLPAALVVAYLVALIPSHARAGGLAAACVVTLLPLIAQGPNEVVTAREGPVAMYARCRAVFSPDQCMPPAPHSTSRADLPKPIAETSAFLRDHYNGGVILIQSFGNESLLFRAKVPLTNNVYEGSYQKWDPALSSPAGQRIKWIVMRGGKAPDETYRELHGSDELSQYTEVFNNGPYIIYERKA